MAALLYQSRSRSPIWLALIASALLHGAAVAFAEFRRAEPVVNFQTEPAGDPEIDIEYPPLSPPSALPDIPDPTPPPLPKDDPVFSDESTAPPPSKVRAPIIRDPSPHSPRVSPPGSARVFALNAPRPEYPYEARRGRITGEGIASLTIDPATGRVIEVTMLKSTGSAVLDQAAIAGFRRWRFRPGTPATVRCPITYTLTGAMF